MMQMPSNKEDSSRLKNIFDLSAKEVEEVLLRKKPITDVTKVAVASIATYSRLKSTEVHEFGLIIVMRKMLPRGTPKAEETP